jgi:hypothetical protein
MIAIVLEPDERGVLGRGRRRGVVADARAGPRQIVEVVAGVRRDTGVAARLEVLLRTAGDARVLEQLAQECCAASGRRADQV